MRTRRARVVRVRSTFALPTHESSGSFYGQGCVIVLAGFLEVFFCGMVGVFGGGRRDGRVGSWCFGGFLDFFSFEN